MTTNMTIDIGAPSDAELEQLAVYISGYMTRAERDAFEARVVEDEAFFLRVTPVLDAWYMDSPSPVATSAAEPHRHEAGSKQ